MAASAFNGTPAAAQAQRQLFDELRDAGGFNLLAQLVCFPNNNQDQDSVFYIVAFSKDFASTLRKKAKPIPKEALEAERSAEKDHFLMQWIYRNGVVLNIEPETLDSVANSKGTTWSREFSPPDKTMRSTKFTLRMVFSASGRFSRDVLVDGVIRKSIHGKCEPIE